MRAQAAINIAIKSRQTNSVNMLTLLVLIKQTFKTLLVIPMKIVLKTVCSLFV